MGDVERRALELVQLLHRAPGSAADWITFLEALRNEMSPDTVALFAAQPHATRPGILAGSGLGVSPVRLADFLRPSQPHPPANRVPAGTVIPLEPGGRFEKTLLFRDVLEPAGIRAGPGFLVVTERTEQLVIAATLVLPRASSKWRPRAADQALLELLAPHMVIARQMHNRLVARARDAEALISAFDRLVLGVVFVDENERVSFANRSAAELLGVAPGFTDAATLASDLPDERTRAWRRLLASNADPVGRSALFLAHPEDGRPLQVLATRFTWGEHEASAAARFGRAMFIGDPKQRTGDPAGVLHELYGLTRSETRLALLLLADRSLEEAAGSLGITQSTARGVLKTIFAKTGTNRQASLVRLLLSGPPGHVRGEGAAPAESAPPLAASGTGRAARRH